MILSTPLESVYQDEYFAMLDMKTNRVTIFLACQYKATEAVDSFTWDEYTEIIDEGTVNPDTKRLTINW
jgi:hypothetical protein